MGELTTTMWWILVIGCLGSAVMAQSEVSVEFSSVDAMPSEIYIGNKILMEFKMIFPASTTTTDAKAELILSLVEMVFAIGDIISCDVGNDLTVANTNFCTDVVKHSGSGYSSTDGVRYHNRAAFDIGDVIGAGGGSEASHTVTVTFEAVYISLGTNNIASTYWLSVGLEYSAGVYIWIAQCSITLQGPASNPGTTPNFNIEFMGDNMISDDGEEQLVELTFGLPNPKSNITVEIVSLNDTDCALVIHNVNMTSVGSAYQYAVEPSLISASGGNECCPTSLSLEFIDLVNKDSTSDNPNQDDYNMVFEITTMVANSSIPDGAPLVLGAAIFVDSSEIWVYSITAEKKDGSPAFATFVSEIVHGLASVSAGKPCGVSMTISVPPGSTELTISVTTDAGTASKNGLNILAVNPVAYGDNINCEISTKDWILVKTYSSTVPGLYDKLDLTFMIFNDGMLDTNGASDVEFSVFFLMSGDAIEGETHVATIGISGANSQQHTFTVAAPSSVDTNLQYNFDLQHNCQDMTQGFQSGSIILFMFTVVTERNKFGGNSTLELPIPADLVNSYLTFVSAEVVFVGVNVPCVNYGPLNVELFDWTGSEPGTNDRAVASLTVCNFVLSNDTEDDKFIIAIKIKLKDVPELLQADSGGDTSLALGIQYTSNQIFVLDYPLDQRSIPSDLGGVKLVKGIQLPADVSLPSDAVIQWSPDNLKFYDFQYGMMDYIYVPGESTNLLLNTRLFARYVRVVNSDGGCPVVHTFLTQEINDDIQFDGNSNTSVFLQSLMLAFDNDTTTCMDLPTKNSANTPTYFVANILTTPPYLDTNGEAPFNVTVTGHKLSCNTPLGPQVTKVAHPKNSDTLRFVGTRKRCKLLEETGADPDPISCTYTCNCSDATTCADLRFMILHHGSPSGNYSLCDITATQ